VPSGQTWNRTHRVHIQHQKTCSTPHWSLELELGTWKLNGRWRRKCCELKMMWCTWVSNTISKPWMITSLTWMKTHKATFHPTDTQPGERLAHAFPCNSDRTEDGLRTFEIRRDEIWKGQVVTISSSTGYWNAMLKTMQVMKQVFQTWVLKLWT